MAGQVLDKADENAAESRVKEYGRTMNAPDAGLARQTGKALVTPAESRTIRLSSRFSGGLPGLLMTQRKRFAPGIEGGVGAGVSGLRRKLLPPTLLSKNIYYIFWEVRRYNVKDVRILSLRRRGHE